MKCSTVTGSSFQDDVIYTLTNTSSDAASQFFYVNPYSGVITLSRSLSETTITDFRVSPSTGMAKPVPYLLGK